MALRRERVLLLVLLAAVIVVWWLALGAGPSDLTITVLDVGQGDSILVQSPGGQNLLIDGGGRVGESTGGYDVGRDVVLPALMARGVRKLDALVITHPHEDHTGGLAAVVQQIPVGLVLDPTLGEETDSHTGALTLLAAKKVPVHRATEGQQLNLGGGVRLQVLNPPDPRLTGDGSESNNNSLVMRLSYGRFSLLLAGDVEELGAARVARLGPAVHSTILKVPHHGSSSAARTALFSAIHPDVAVISVGANNTFGHPSQETLDELARAGAKVLRTDRDGAVTIRVRPPRWWATGYVGGAQAKQYSGEAR